MVDLVTSIRPFLKNLISYIYFGVKHFGMNFYHNQLFLISSCIINWGIRMNREYNSIFKVKAVCVAALAGMCFVCSPAWAEPLPSKATTVITLANDGKIASSQSKIKKDLIKFDGLMVDFKTLDSGSSLCVPLVTNVSDGPIAFGYTSLASFDSQTKTVSRIILGKGDSESVDIDKQIYCVNAITSGSAVGSEVEVAQFYVVVNGECHWWEIKWWPIATTTTPTDNKKIFMSAERLK
ncbi:hypothetical protein [Burkholderia cenocepacia]|uniref:hypothetical protein n=1 Tax=Burkholderia cenocepacia TaxID=95486 RepID=UPI002B255044|nr:hypothetical protein [Burkholderia cenocepacia]MEB2558738.1 hypothetical protein [Burkholderia cenocepacia]